MSELTCEDVGCDCSGEGRGDVPPGWVVGEWASGQGAGWYVHTANARELSTYGGTFDECIPVVCEGATREEAIRNAWLAFGVPCEEYKAGAEALRKERATK